MNKKHIYIVLFLIILTSYCAFAQNDCEVPSPPELTYVSVLPETSTILLNWTLSPSSDIAAYIIYLYETILGNPGFFAIDTLWNPSATSYLDLRIQNKSFLQYRIAAFRIPTCASELSNVLSTIFVETQIDSCKRKINVSWNKYTPPAPQKVLDYSVLVSLNGNDFSEIGKAAAENSSFVFNNFTVNSDYYFEVRANLEGGSYSLSNIAYQQTKIQNPPGWINADYATVKDKGSISLSFSIDPSSEIDSFALERKTGYSGSFMRIALISGTDIESVSYIDNDAKADVVNFYKLSAIKCNSYIISSNFASNIVLASQNTGSDINLRWNMYQKWNGAISSYRIYMDTGNGFSEKGKQVRQIQHFQSVFRI